MSRKDLLFRQHTALLNAIKAPSPEARLAHKEEAENLEGQLRERRAGRRGKDAGIPTGSNEGE